LLVVFLVSSGGFAGFAYQRLSVVKVNGPVYARIAQGKDLVAGILPPPEYIMEAYLNVRQPTEAAASGAPAAIQANLLAQAATLRSDYETRHAYWAQALPDGPIKQTMIEAGYAPAMQFFTVRDGEFLPALKAGQSAQAQQILRDKLQPAYEAHRAAIDQVVRLADAQNQQTEAEAAQTVAQDRFGRGGE
jgi:methyl-accepting chemotaxis protein